MGASFLVTQHHRRHHHHIVLFNRPPTNSWEHVFYTTVVISIFGWLVWSGFGERERARRLQLLPRGYVFVLFWDIWEGGMAAEARHQCQSSCLPGWLCHWGWNRMLTADPLVSETEQTSSLGRKRYEPRRHAPTSSDDTRRVNDFLFPSHIHRVHNTTQHTHTPSLPSGLCEFTVVHACPSFRCEKRVSPLPIPHPATPPPHTTTSRK